MCNKKKATWQKKCIIKKAQNYDLLYNFHFLLGFWMLIGKFLLFLYLWALVCPLYCKRGLWKLERGKHMAYGTKVQSL